MLKINELSEEIKSTVNDMTIAKESLDSHDEQLADNEINNLIESNERTIVNLVLNDSNIPEEIKNNINLSGDITNIRNMIFTKYIFGKIESGGI